MFVCLECGRKFKENFKGTTKAAERAAFGAGCPNCGSTDIDLDLGSPNDEASKDDVSCLLALAA